MTGISQPIQARYIVRQTTEPASRGPPWTWINPDGGGSGNNRERYNWNSDTETWELTNSVGPDTPLNPANGALWRDTNLGEQNVYDNGWKQVGTGIAASRTDDGSDISQYRMSVNATSGTIVDITGTGVCIGGQIIARSYSQGATDQPVANITVDGGTTYTHTGAAWYSGADYNGQLIIPGIEFGSSLSITVDQASSTDYMSGTAVVKQ